MGEVSSVPALPMDKLRPKYRIQSVTLNADPATARSLSAFSSYSALGQEGREMDILESQVSLEFGEGSSVRSPFRTLSELINHLVLAERKRLAFGLTDMLQPGLVEAFMASEAIAIFGEDAAQSLSTLTTSSRSMTSMTSIDAKEASTRIGSYDTHFVLVHIPLVPWLR